MVVDDSATIRTVLERSLKMTKVPIEGIVQAVNGRDALAKMADTWVDIVFTDIHMPEMDGMALIDAMNADPALRDIPVVVVSTEGSEVRIEELRRKGAKGYLRKPFTPEALRDVIISTLGGWDE